MNDPKALIKDTILFIVCGVIVQLIVYTATKMFLSAEELLPASILLIALSINGLIFFVGCVRKSLVLIEEIDKLRKDK